MMVAPTKLRGDLLSLAELGFDPDACLKDFGLSFEAILAQRPVSHNMMSGIYGIVAAIAPDDFAISCGQQIKLQYLGLLGYRLSNCATIGDLLSDWAEFCGQIGYPLSAALETSQDAWRMTFAPRYPLMPEAENFCVTSTLAGFTQSVFNLSGHRLRLRRIGFTSPKPDRMEAYAQLEADELLFNCAVPFVEGDRRDLERQNPTADANLLKICDELCRQAWDGASGSLASRLGTLLRSEGPLDLARASELLGMSARSLQRHLATEGSGFHEILDEYRHMKALLLLRQGKRGKMIANLLGFDDDSSFRRSFKRWTGQSVSEWRRQPASGIFQAGTLAHA
ncbi:helix-turn-helix domain-containing protein [Sphingobium sp. CR2-8]|uniref:helix-turn-helix domain-containing protein n=1 Tax=Sphingobium sp. CR2-8 TaxID=1306534 RepID=UPI002DBCAE5F|nr:helix-turn-helix domain-containing protein [Sphingobium sp. CR2-8]MEC3909125.1 helix-turn-helix domain-containing protein [Sphingobium sp. CR2-8]